MKRTFRYSMRPTRRQAALLEDVLSTSADLYNAALQERRDAWRMAGKSISYFDQCHELTKLRAEDETVRSIPVEIAREPLRRVHRAFQAFFRRCKAGDKPGYPRFRSKDRYNSFALSAPGFRLEGDRLYVWKLGGFKFKLHRPVRGTPQHVTVVRSGRRWRVGIVCELGAAPAKRTVSRSVGIDVGLKQFAVLSDGAVIDNPRFLRTSEAELARAQRALSRKRCGSANRRRARQRVARCYERIANRRANFCHHVSKRLVVGYDLIAFEDLNIKGMAGSNLAKSIHDAAWGFVIRQLIYKAEGAGRWAIPVNPRGTTQRCARCAALVPKELGERVHRCACGFVASRDHNAALNVLALGRSAAGLHPTEVPETQ
jgi:putative transposase